MTHARLLIGLVCLAPGIALAASVQDIRIASHPDHVRVVLDLDGSVTFTPAGANAFQLHGLTGGGAVMNAQAKDAPLKRVVLAPDGDGTKLSFETSMPVKAEAFPIGAGGNGGHRFVVDLYTAAPAAEHAPAPSGMSADNSPTSPPATRGPAAYGPAVPAVPAFQPSPTLAAQEPSRPAQAPYVLSTASYAAVAPSNPPDVGPTPYETADAQASAPAERPAALRPSASAAPMNTIPFASAHSTEPPAPVQTAYAAPADAHNASADDAALRAERALDRGNAKAACAAANEALNAAPQNLRAMAVLGSCQLALGDAVSARAAFTNALAIDPGYHRARIGLAETEVRQGNLAAARQEYRRVLADNPPTDETYKILDALQALAPPTPLAVTAQGT